MKNPTPRIQMIEGFNEAWIEFEGGFEGSVKGKPSLTTVTGNTMALCAEMGERAGEILKAAYKV
jgi:hypothetical protein